MEDVAGELYNELRCLREVEETLSSTAELIRHAGKTSMVGDSPTAGKLYKAGLGLVFLVPVPIASEVAGSFLIALGKILSERSKKPVGLKLSEALDDLMRLSSDI